MSFSSASTEISAQHSCLTGKIYPAASECNFPVHFDLLTFLRTIPSQLRRKRKEAEMTMHCGGRMKNV